MSYDDGVLVRKVRDHGEIRYRGCAYLVGRGFTGEWVALHQVEDGVLDVYYCRQRVGQVDERERNHVSEH